MRFRLTAILLIVIALLPGVVWAAMSAAEQDMKLAGLYLKLGQLAECRAAVQKVLATQPGNVAAQVVLSKLELREGKFTAALKAAEAALALAPDELDALIVKARALSATGKQAEAQKILARIPPAELDARADDIDGAPALNQNAAVTAPVKTGEEVLDDALDGARAALAGHHLDKADKFTQQALKLAPENADAMALRADYLADAGHPAEAAVLLKKLKARHTDARTPFGEELALAFALQDAGQVDEARASFTIVANDERFPDDEQKQAREALAGSREDRLLDEGDKALDAGNIAEAARIADEALKADPNNAEAKTLHARVLAVTGHAGEAVSTLRALKAETPAGKRFDGQGAYATALAEDHQYRDSLAEWNAIADSSAFNDEERADARDEIADLQERHLAGGMAEGLYGKFEEGTLWREKLQLNASRIGRNRWSVSGELDQIELQARLFPHRMNEDRFSTSVGLDHLISREWSVHAAIGGFADGVMANAGFTYETASGVSLTLDAAYNDLARDTLLLQAMEGRQHSLTANFMVPLGKHFAIESTVLGRQIEADGTNIGHSIGTETQVRWHPFTLTRDVYLAYVLELKDFSGKEAAFDRAAHDFFGPTAAFVPGVYDAVPDRINRHALQAHGSVLLVPNLTASAMAEVAWRQETDTTEFGALMELLWKVSSRASLNARVEYYSGGSGPNAGEDVILATLGTQWRW